MPPAFFLSTHAYNQLGERFSLLPDERRAVVGQPFEFVCHQLGEEELWKTTHLGYEIYLPCIVRPDGSRTIKTVLEPDQALGNASRARGMNFARHLARASTVPSAPTPARTAHAQLLAEQAAAKAARKAAGLAKQQAEKAAAVLRKEERAQKKAERDLQAWAAKNLQT